MQSADSTSSVTVPIHAATRAVEGGLILYDAAQSGKVHDHVFTPAYWRVRQSIGEPLGGRGAAWRIKDENIDWVLRYYRRGGLPGKLLDDTYLNTGTARSRPWREWKLLAWMWSEGLPVPRPVAARILYAGIFYRAALITETVGGDAFAAKIYNNRIQREEWAAVGRCIRRFHDADVWHADLNANNILLDADAQVSLLDFDRARLRSGRTNWREANLARLRRSLDKLFPQRDSVRNGWPVLLDAYHDG